MEGWADGFWLFYIVWNRRPYPAAAASAMGAAQNAEQDQTSHVT